MIDVAWHMPQEVQVAIKFSIGTFVIRVARKPNQTSSSFAEEAARTVRSTLLHHYTTDVLQQLGAK